MAWLLWFLMVPPQYQDTQYATGIWSDLPGGKMVAIYTWHHADCYNPTIQLWSNRWQPKEPSIAVFTSPKCGLTLQLAGKEWIRMEGWHEWKDSFHHYQIFPNLIW